MLNPGLGSSLLPILISILGAQARPVEMWKSAASGRPGRQSRYMDAPRARSRAFAEPPGGGI